MRAIPGKTLDPCRIRNGPWGSGDKDGMTGAWLVPCGGGTLQVISSVGGGWDHVSVSLNDRCPTWEEMNFVKDLFFEPHECVMQLHPPKSNYVNVHPNCLHLWRPQATAIPQPPRVMV
jgi:hypothetical protein